MDSRSVLMNRRHQFEIQSSSLHSFTSYYPWEMYGSNTPEEINNRTNLGWIQTSLEIFGFHQVILPETHHFYCGCSTPNAPTTLVTYYTRDCDKCNVVWGFLLQFHLVFPLWAFLLSMANFKLRYSYYVLWFRWSVLKRLSYILVPWLSSHS